MTEFNETELENAVAAVVKFLEDTTVPSAMPTHSQRATLKAYLAYRKRKDEVVPPFMVPFRER